MSTVLVHPTIARSASPSITHATMTSGLSAEDTTPTAYATTSRSCLLAPPARSDPLANCSPTEAKQATTAHQPPLADPQRRYSIVSSHPPVYSLSADDLVSALDHVASQPLPDANEVFPWLHGLHPRNRIQLMYFLPGRRTPPREPPGFIRQVLIVKAGKDLRKSVLRGAVSPKEIMSSSGKRFTQADPATGFSVRNFGIQTAKLAVVSDIVVYGDDDTPEDEVLQLACRLSDAQDCWAHQENRDSENRRFNTFILSDSFEELNQRHPSIVAIDPTGNLVGEIVDFDRLESLEMCKMNKVSEIADNVWQGPTYDKHLNAEDHKDRRFDLVIEANDWAHIPEMSNLMSITDQLRAGQSQKLQFPSSGVLQPGKIDEDESRAFINTLKWMYELANPDTLADSKASHPPLKIFIHCPDGYTETSLLCLAYMMYADGLQLHEAHLKLHCEKKREFFIYPTDSTLLRSLEPHILDKSPARATRCPTDADREAERREKPPQWMTRSDSTLPSRITPYMYLGNISHATNSELLRALGIGRILSVGEPVSWSDTTLKSWGEENLLAIDSVQDNGIDSLIPHIDRCLEFIDQGKRNGTATLVHCRVGVSRSASICVAEVMSSMTLSFAQAYCMVRARRLNVVIQPNLRFVYELMVWDEILQRKRGQPVRRQLEWPTVTREIALLNNACS